MQNVFVSSDFDQKEQQSRNLLRVVGPFTELVGVFVLWPGETLYNVTVLWVDPRMSVVATGHLLMDDSPLVRINLEGVGKLFAVKLFLY